MTRMQKGVRNAMFDLGLEIGKISRGKQKNPFPVNTKVLYLVLIGKQNLVSIELEAELLDFLQENKYV